MPDISVWAMTRQSWKIQFMSMSGIQRVSESSEGCENMFVLVALLRIRSIAFMRFFEGSLNRMCLCKRAGFLIGMRNVRKGKKRKQFVNIKNILFPCLPLPLLHTPSHIFVCVFQACIFWAELSVPYSIWTTVWSNKTLFKTGLSEIFYEGTNRDSATGSVHV